MKSVLFWLFITGFALWAGTAIWVQFASARPLVLAIFAAGLGVVLWQRLSGRYGWVALLLLMVAVFAWYFSLAPRQDRDWASDVAHNVAGEISGDIVHLKNIRAFRWQTADIPSHEAWISRDIDLRKIAGADMITSVWGNPLIAHLLVSFRFTDGAPLTFSVEIRREKGESFSPLGGFFRQFELSLIAAEEADILAWRAGPRGEEVRLYPLALTPDQARQVFLGYVTLGNRLNEKPQWYNTVTSNCTTVVWQLSKVLSPDLPLDQSLLLSGRLPEYLEKLGALAGTGSLEEKRARALISEKVRSLSAGADFSQAIRAE